MRSPLPAHRLLKASLAMRSPVPSPRRRAVLAAWAAAVALPLAAAWPASEPRAQDFPSRRISIVVPFTPGGSTDVATRSVAEAMSRILGQPVVVENMAGASGMIGTEHVVRAAPDGYVTGAIGISTGVLPHLMGPVPRFKFDDVTFVGQIAFAEFVIVARKSLEADTVAQLVALAKSRPGKLSYGESGTATQLGFELFKSMTGTDFVRVPYKGDAPAVNDLMGGHVDVALISLSGASAQIRAGGIKVIGVTSRERSRAFPEAPTIAEAGLEGYESGGPTMLTVPRGTPAPVIARLNAALNEALTDPALIERFGKMGLGVRQMSPEQSQAAMKAELDKSARVIRDARIPTDR